MARNPMLILVNPWIHDFAAYDLWSKPMGLLMLASMLRGQGYELRLVDCLDVHHPDMQRYKNLHAPKRRDFGTGKFWKQIISKPEPLKPIDRPYSRYGIHPDIFRQELEKAPRPDAILVTSLMTYWYPGVFETISIAKEIHPDVPVILGGIYARLCTKHAREKSGAHYIVDSASPDSLLNLLKQLGPEAHPPSAPSFHPYPAFDLLRRLEYICILASTGCPYRCRYCASDFLFPAFHQRDPEEVFPEIVYWYQNYGIKDFAFYDDALLVGAEKHFIPLMEEVVKTGIRVRFHTPNAIHIRVVSKGIAHLMKKAGFQTIRIGLETADFDLRRKLDNKISQGEFERGVQNLLKAGFHPSQIGAYILVGLPGQSVESVLDTINFVEANDIMPYLAEYSPLPHTDLWEEAINASEYDIQNEPLFHNNTLLPCWDESKRARMPELKRKVREVRERLVACSTQNLFVDAH